MKEFLDNIKKKDPAARSYLQIILFYPGVHALFLHRITHVMYNLKIPLIPYLIAYVCRALTAIEIHPAVKIGKKAFYKQAEMSLESAYNYTAEVMAENMLNNDTKEGIQAFIEKRSPEWL